jgi:phosphate transport system substrate-binding protein
MSGLVLAGAALAVATSAYAAEITGAGSSFVYPLVAKWAEAYAKETGSKINYQSVGSGAGIKQIVAKTVDFGASDKPLSPEELAKDGLVQFPVVSGGVVAIVNIPGVKSGELKLTGAVLADIFLGKIKKWDDAAIVGLNQGLKLPATDITVVQRSDSSGTSFLFTNYLSKVSPEFKTTVGEGTAVKWPVGIGGKGNEGVASSVKQFPGAVGYVEYAYAVKNGIAYTQLKNQAGEFVKPSLDSFSAAAAGADWTKALEFQLILTDAPGKKSWPIVGAVFVLVHAASDKPAQTQEVIKFFRWGFAKNGAALAKELDYVPVPDKLAKLVEAAWKAKIKAAP